MADHATTDPRGRSSEEIRRDIERTRSDMDHTVDELEARLSPGRVLDEVWHRVKDGGADGIGSAVKDHPVPLALMGLGLGWLAVEQATGHSASPGRDGGNGRGTRAPADGRRGPYTGDAVDHDDPDWEHAGAGTRARAKTKEAAGELEDAASSARAKVADAASAAKEKVSGAAGSAKSSAREAARSARRTAEQAGERASAGASRAASQAKSGFWSMMDDNPLAVGAIAFGLGLASGVSAPSSRTEDRLMGHASDTVKDEVKRVGRETTRKAKRVAEDARDAAADEARRQREKRDVEGSLKEGARQAKDTAAEAADEVTEAAKEVGRAAKDAAERRAEDEGLA